MEGQPSGSVSGHHGVVLQSLEQSVELIDREEIDRENRLQSVEPIDREELHSAPPNDRVFFPAPTSAPQIDGEFFPAPTSAPRFEIVGPPFDSEFFPEESGVNKQCIFVVPRKVRELNPKAYTPQVLSIGPFHNPRRIGGGDNFLEPMEYLKRNYREGFLNRTGRCKEYFHLKLEEWENRILSCYETPVPYSSRDDFLPMIFIDACFIIEYFLKCYTKDWEKNDPLLLKPWLTIDIKRDLLLLENQLPFFLLNDIYNLAGLNIKFPSFLKITFLYFKVDNFPNMDPEEVCPCPKHFIDLLRTSMLPPSIADETTEEEEVIEHLYSATQLSEAGLVFKAIPKDKPLLDLEFYEGELKMPSFRVYDSTETYIRNILAFEVCHFPRTQYISQYLKILDFLINTDKDVKILVDKKIIVNLMGDANEVATMVNSLCKNIPMPYLSSKNVTLFKNLNGFYEHPCNKYKAIFRQEYWNTPWKKASTIAAVLLLLLTLIQTICSVISLA